MVEAWPLLCQTGRMLGKCHKHLESVREGYFEHMGFALRFGVRMIGGGLAAIIHGIVPALFEKTGSRVLFGLYDDVQARLKPSRPDDPS